MITRFLLLAIAASYLSGCISNSLYGGPCYGKTLPQLMDSTNLKPLFREMACELCSDFCSNFFKKGDNEITGLTPQMCAPDDKKRLTVMVTDFVDIKAYTPEHSGLLMGELMRGSLNQTCCYKIVQAEFGKYFKLNENGLISLTRRVSEIKTDDYPQPEVVVGTYNYLNNSKVLLFVRRINTSTGHVVKMVTREVDYSCSGRNISYEVR